MSIIRLIHIKIDPSEKEKAERVWKTECAKGDAGRRKIVRSRQIDLSRDMLGSSLYKDQCEE